VRIGNAAPVSLGMTFDELVASLRQIDGQRDKGKHPPNLHFGSKPFLLHFHNRPDRTYADVRFGGTSSRSPLSGRGRGERTDRTAATRARDRDGYRAGCIVMGD
jgi:hypothetical protein